MLRSRDFQTGSAPVEFLAFGVPGVFVIVVGIQLCFAAYLNTVAYDAAVEGAYASSASDGSDVAAQSAAKRVLDSFKWQAVNAITVNQIPITDGSLSEVAVEVTSPLLMFGSLHIKQISQAFNEPR